MLSKENNKNSGGGNDRRIWNSSGIMLVTLDWMYGCWRKDPLSICWDYWQSEKWLRIYMVYTSIKFVFVVQDSEVKVPIIWTQITREGAMWFWFRHDSMRIILSVLKMKKLSLCKSPSLSSEQQLAAPHGSDSWQCLLPMQPYPQHGLLQGGLCVRASLSSAEKKKGKDGEIALWSIIHSVFQDLLNYFTLRHLVVLNRDECHSCCQGPVCVPPAGDLAAGLRAGANLSPQGLLHPCCPACAQRWPWTKPPPHPSLGPSSSPHLTLDPLTVPDFPNTSSDSQSHYT